MIDLHTHSTASDGFLSPSELLHAAEKIGLEALALTDHDAVSGLDELHAAAAKNRKVEIVNGAELSVFYPGAEMEILALDIPEKSLPAFREYQQNELARRDQMAHRRIELLQNFGVDITYEEVALDKDGNPRTQIRRPHFTDVLLKKGYIQNTEEAYKVVFARGGIAFVENRPAPAAEIIDFIRSNGAAAVMAHPIHTKFKPDILYNVVRELQQAGLSGIEVFHASQPRANRQLYLDIIRDLGLIIIDEEQRFGVAQKEKLKELYPKVDVLTLTATPIPRTLNMALSGIRDMSILEEAPHDRSPVQTYVVEHNPEMLAQAMNAELRRGGQVYYLHNRVESIEHTAAKIKDMLPDAVVGIAHGKMSEDELSEVWRKLLEGEIDILVCTTIIETGVDVPNVNTLIIEDADRMGLAQLHQIRGRVGRSSRRASAYLTFRPGRELTEIATSRLDAIREFTEFGSGFKIAMRDLELRGAGNVLGAQQHGHMEAVGYEMYLQMLEQAISEERGDQTKKPKKECLVDLPIDAHIPPTYIESVPQRLGIYRRIADITSRADADDVTDELIDRFGEPPAPVLGLIRTSLLRAYSAQHNIYEIGRKGDKLLLYIDDLDMQEISAIAAGFPGRVTVSAAGKPHIAVRIMPQDKMLDLLEKVLMLMNTANKQKDS